MQLLDIHIHNIHVTHTLICIHINTCTQYTHKYTTRLASPRSEAQVHVCWYVAPPGECYYNILLCSDDYFSSSSVVSRAFSVLIGCSKFGHHPHPLDYLCTKFHFFHGLYCWASPWRKTHIQSLNQPAYLMPLEPKIFRICTHTHIYITPLKLALFTFVRIYIVNMTTKPFMSGKELSV